jgi:hypothetical protein
MRVSEQSIHFFDHLYENEANKWISVCIDWAAVLPTDTCLAFKGYQACSIEQFQPWPHGFVYIGFNAGALWQFSISRDGVNPQLPNLKGLGW